MDIFREKQKPRLIMREESSPNFQLGDKRFFGQVLAAQSQHPVEQETHVQP